MMNHEGWLFFLCKGTSQLCIANGVSPLLSGSFVFDTFCGFWLVVSRMCGSELRVFLTSLVLSGSCSLLASFLLVPTCGSCFWFLLLVPTSGFYFSGCPSTAATFFPLADELAH